MQTVVSCLIAVILCFTSLQAFAQDAELERFLRSQVFNKEFEGFGRYSVIIEDDHVQTDGSREVTVVASGKFFEQVKRVKVLFLIVGEQVIGGQVLEETGLPPCKSSSPSSSL